MSNSLQGDPEIGKVLITQDQLRERVSELGRRISEDFAGKNLTVVAMLKGSFIFAADLLRAITIDVSIDFMAISSYSEKSVSGVVRITKDLDQSIADKNVLLVEDIVDTGLTANYLTRALRQRNPASVEVCALLDKTARRIIDQPIAYSGFEIPDLFVVGYGMDYQQRYRNLPYIATLRNITSP
jgi:hypoxanthine phosphoribosyltransferase